VAAPAHAPPNRRDRIRAATLAEITRTARRLLIEQGAEGVSLRAIAREMGMTAPALYRYFACHEDLRTAVADQLFGELVEALRDARDAHRDADIVQRGLDTVRAFRRWAVEHPREFEVIFGRPLPAAEDMPEFDLPNCFLFGATFLELFAEIWACRPFPVPADDEIDPRLAEQLALFRQQNGAETLPLGALQVFLGMWVQIYGLVALEVLGHLRFALRDVEPLFETVLTELIARLYAGQVLSDTAGWLTKP